MESKVISMGLLGKRKLKLLISLGRALTLTEQLRGLQAFSGLKKILKSSKKLAECAEEIHKGESDILPNKEARDIMQRIFDSLGFIRGNKLTRKGKELVKAEPWKRRSLITSALKGWEPLRILAEYLNEVEVASFEQIVEDLGSTIEKRTEKLINLNLIDWQSTPFQSLNRHKLESVIRPLGKGHNFLTGRNRKLSLTEKGSYLSTRSKSL